MREQRFSELRLESVSRNFGETAALRELSLTIRGGEFLALLGPSGCGKSTALNCLAGLLPLSGGRIWLDDRRIDGLPPEQRGFGMVFQNYALFPHMTVRENIAFGLKMRKVPKHEQRSRVDEVLRLIRLEDHARKLPPQLSGGQQQRVAIARALVQQPFMLLADEPVASLDPDLSQHILSLLCRLAGEARLALLCSLHQHDLAERYFDRIVLLRDGMMSERGRLDMQLVAAS